jgi:cell division ATPase FtsA
VLAELRRSGFEELLSSGIVLTGGSALLQGMTELGEEVFHLPVRVGVPGLHGRSCGCREKPALRDRGRLAARKDANSICARSRRARKCPASAASRNG